MRNLLIGVIVAFIATTSLYSQPISRQEIDALKARVTVLESNHKDKSRYQNKNVYRVSVNYDLSLEKAVNLGNEWSNPDIISNNFLSKSRGKAKVDIELIYFNSETSSFQVLDKMDSLGLRPANAQELLALGKQYPKLQLEFPITELGTVLRHVSGDRGVLVLCSDGFGGDKLCRYSFPYDWRAVYRFAAVVK